MASFLHDEPICHCDCYDYVKAYLHVYNLATQLRLIRLEKMRQFLNNAPPMLRLVATRKSP